MLNTFRNDHRDEMLHRDMATIVLVGEIENDGMVQVLLLLYLNYRISNYCVPVCGVC